MGWSKACKPKCCNTPETIWYKLNCSDLRFTSEDDSVSITRTDSCAFDFSVNFPESGTVTSVAATITTGAISIAGSPITTSGTLAFTYGGTTSQYIRGDGSLATFPTLTASANNGLSVSGSDTVFGQNVSEVGSPASLLSDREIPLNNFSIFFTGVGRVAIGTSSPGSLHKFTSIATGIDIAIQATAASNIALNAVNTGAAATIVAQNTGTGGAIEASSVGSAGIAVKATSSNNGAIPFRAVAFNTANSSSTPTVAEFIRHASGGVAADGIGMALMFRDQTTTTTEVESGQIRNYFTTALHGSRSSAFEFHLVNNTVSARKVLINPTGQLKFDAYGSGTFTGTPTYNLQADASGNIIEQSVSLIPTISSGTVAPATTPGKVGDIYIDTTGLKLYFATGTASSADWIIAN